MTALQKFTVVQKYEGFEVREFEPCVVADVLVNGDVVSAGNKGFMPLFNYISSNKIAMTAPVIEEEIESDQWRISFVMPAETRLIDLPNPHQSPVMLREIPSHRAAVLAFRGRTTPNNVREQELRLLLLLKQQGVKVTGNARIARYDPPWKPPFARHNEVIIPIE